MMVSVFKTPRNTTSLLSPFPPPSGLDSGKRWVESGRVWGYHLLSAICSLNAQSRVGVRGFLSEVSVIS